MGKAGLDQDERTTVLVVDDEEPLRRVVRRALEPEGCTILEAPDGETALRLLQRLESSPDLVLTDLRMPRVSGRELAEVLSVFRPGVPVIAMTGFAGSAHPDRRLPLLVKPFTKPALLEVVKNARIRRAIFSTARVEQRSRARRLREVVGDGGNEVDLVSAVQLLRALPDEDSR